jgi:hypothetical protein
LTPRAVDSLTASLRKTYQIPSFISFNVGLGGERRRALVEKGKGPWVEKGEKSESSEDVGLKIQSKVTVFDVKLTTFEFVGILIKPKHL